MGQATPAPATAGRLVAQPGSLGRMPIQPVVRGQDKSLPIQVGSQTQSRSARPARDALAKLSPPTDPQQQRKPPTSPSGGRALTTVLASLGIVLGVFFGAVWLARKNAPAGMAVLPPEVVESLGRAPLAARQQMQLIRLGNRLLLLSVTPQGAETLAEVTDRDEVDRLAGICQQHRSGSVSHAFRKVLTQISAESTNAGFLDANRNQRGSGRRVSQAG